MSFDYLLFLACSRFTHSICVHHLWLFFLCTVFDLSVASSLVHVYKVNFHLDRNEDSISVFCRFSYKTQRMPNTWLVHNRSHHRAKKRKRKWEKEQEKTEIQLLFVYGMEKFPIIWQWEQNWPEKLTFASSVRLLGLCVANVFAST